MIFLNVGGNNKLIPTLSYYKDWEHHLLDIDPKGNPDICCDAQLLQHKPEFHNKYDSVYCSHNLEHYYRHKVRGVLSGFYKVLKDDGFCYIAVPHIMNVLRRVVAFNMELTDPLYSVSAGPISPHDVMYGWGLQLERSGQEYFVHKCAFTPKMLRDAFGAAGFPFAWTLEVDLNLVGIASKIELSEEVVKRIIES